MSLKSSVCQGRKSIISLTRIGATLQFAVTTVDYAIGSDGRSVLATGDSGGVLRIWHGSAAVNLECNMTGTMLTAISAISLLIEHPVRPTTPALTGRRPSQQTQTERRQACVAGTVDGHIAVFDIIGKKCTFSAAGHTGPITGIYPIRDFEVLTCSADRSVRLWDVRAEGSSLCIYGHCGPVTCLKVGKSNRAGEFEIADLLVCV